MCSHPSEPMAPPWTRASLQKATTGTPSMRPVTARTPLLSSGVIGRTDPSSRSLPRRTSGSRGSAASAAGAEVTTALSSTVIAGSLSGGGEGHGDVVPAEPERVVERRDRPVGQLPRPAADHVHLDAVVEVVDVDGRRDDAVA